MIEEPNYEELIIAAKNIRADVLRMVHAAGSGHPGGSLGMADVFAVLFLSVLEEHDLFYLSNGHICPVLYATLAYTGLINKNELLTFRALGSRLQGHPNHLVPVVQNSSGPLGQGVSQAVGAAKALKLDGLEGRVFCVCGDGELEEGQVWEAALFAQKHKLDNYVQVIDRNKIQIDGFTEKVLHLEPLKDKYLSFGFEVLEVNGHNHKEVFLALTKQKRAGKPRVIIANTTMGKGVSFMENNPVWHGKALNDEELKLALKEILL